jgi:hypothetical protein
MTRAPPRGAPPRGFVIPDEFELIEGAYAAGGYPSHMCLVELVSWLIGLLGCHALLIRYRLCAEYYLHAMLHLFTCL